MTQTRPDRRRHHRFPFSGVVHIRGDGCRWTTPLLDISFKGVLVECTNNQRDINRDQSYQLELVLADGALDLTMEGTVAHIQGDRIGFRINQLDIDSATHLRRLVELNLGDEALLRRELEALVQSA